MRPIDASIAARADSEYLYDKPYTDPKTVRVAGPFTVESLSPHRMLGVDENDDLIDPLQPKRDAARVGASFEQMILENLKTSGVQQAHKEDKISFVSLTPWPGDLICAEGRYLEGDTERRAAIFIGPEFGTVQRVELVSAAREASDADFDVLIGSKIQFPPEVLPDLGHFVDTVRRNDQFRHFILELSVHEMFHASYQTSHSLPT